MACGAAGRVVDARGKPCPLPIVALARALRTAGSLGGEGHDGRAACEVDLWADDPAVVADLHAFCSATGHTLVAIEQDGTLTRARIRDRSASAERR